MTNFDRSVETLTRQGYRPFSPDTRTGIAPRWLRDSEMPPEVAQHAGRMDAVIVAFAAGVSLGWMIGSLA